MKVEIKNIEQTVVLAETLAKLVKKGDVIELRGDLGAGKTTFARYFINSLLGEDQEVLSPTFNLVHPYDTKLFTIWHFDLYRLENASEAEELGIYDAFDDGVSLIEWPEIIGDILPNNRLLLNLLCEGDDREVVITAFGNWEERIKVLDI